MCRPLRYISIRKLDQLSGYAIRLKSQVPPGNFGPMSDFELAIFQIGESSGA
jgi:hypothetical protein